MPARFLEDISLDGEPELIRREVNKPDDVVISGVSGRLPESDNIQEFRDHLMNGDDMVTDDDRRWPPGELLNNRIKGIIIVNIKMANIMIWLIWLKLV